MSKQNTYNKQTAAFIAALVQKIPEISGTWMQELIENPQKMSKRLSSLQPSIKEVLAADKESDLKIIELQPGWEFMIITSSLYEEVGIAVSNHSGQLGLGLNLVIPFKDSHEEFKCPCCCCEEFTRSLNHDRKLSLDKSAKLIRGLEGTSKIRHLLLHNWSNVFSGKIGPKNFFIDPCRSEELSMLDKGRFMKAFKLLRFGMSASKIVNSPWEGHLIS